MADGLHNILPEKLVTIQDLKNEQFFPDKKWLMIDSRAYTPEAFQYVLKLSDIAGSLVFVYDTKKIWANGRYFGGDIFQEDLNYFTDFATYDEEGVFTGIIQANHPKDLMVFQGLNHVKVKATHDEETGSNLITFDYDLKAAVNTNRVEIGGSKYNLVVENGQVKLNEYKPMTVTLSPLPPLEYDSGDSFTTVSFKIYIGGTIPNPELVQLNLGITAEEGYEVIATLDPETNTVTAEIPRNVDVRFDVDYTDGETSGRATVWQKWGYEIIIGIYASSTFGEGTIGVVGATSFTDIMDEMNSNPDIVIDRFIWVPGTKLNKQSNISVNAGNYGMFICPSSLNLEFTDTSVNLTGGWRPVYNLTGLRYSNERQTEYIVWRTDHMGIGLVNWKIVGESE